MFEPYRLKILCSGLPRSGTRWVYNAVRKICGLQEERVLCASHIVTHEVFAMDVIPAPIMIHDQQEPDIMALLLMRNGLASVIFSLREPRESIASLMQARAMSFEDAVLRVGAALGVLAMTIEGGRAHLVAYEDIVDIPDRTISAIADYLDLPVNEQEAADIARMLDRRVMAAAFRPGLASPKAMVDSGLGELDERAAIPADLVRVAPKSSAELLSDENIAHIVKLWPNWLDEDGWLKESIRELALLPDPGPADPEPADQSQH